MLSHVHTLTLDDFFSWMNESFGVLVALRWDLLPTEVVLDLDILASEAVNAPVHRTCLVFSHPTILIPWKRPSIPYGCIVTGGGWSADSSIGGSCVRCYLSCCFQEHDVPHNGSDSNDVSTHFVEVSVASEAHIAIFRSVDGAHPTGETPMQDRLGFERRQALLSDETVRRAFIDGRDSTESS